MHSFRSMWREPAMLLAVPAIIAIVLYDGMFVDPANFEGYWESTFANASIFLIVSAPLGSASAAVIAARARRAGLWMEPFSRSRAAVTFHLLLPSFLAALLLQLVGLLLVSFSSWGAPGRIPLDIVLAWAAILLFHVCVGYLLGRFLPLPLGIPLAIFVSYCWLGFTWTVTYFPIRYLAGLIISSCCSLDTTLDERAVAAVVVFSLLASAALLIAATPPPQAARSSSRLVAALTSIVLVVVATTLGLNIASGLAAQPIVERGRSGLVCTGSAPTICLYPEELQHRDPRPVLAAAYRNLRSAGVRMPAVITASNEPSDRKALRVVVTTRPTTSELVYTLAAGLIPDDNAPYCGSNSDYTKRLDVAAVSTWWLQKVASRGLVDGASLPVPMFTSDSARLIAAFSHLSDGRQRAWYLAASPALKHCSSHPITIPSS